MVRYSGLALLFLVWGSSASAHDLYIFDSRRATPGPSIELIELPPSTGAIDKKYRVKVGAGLPRGVVFGVYTKPFDHAFHEAESGFQLDESGDLVSSDPSGRVRRLEDVVFGPGPYPPGAAWELALVSSDRTIRLFTKAIPYPIVASNGPCIVSLELVSDRGDRFTTSGAGFPPGDEVVTELRYSGRLIQRQQRASPEGRLTPELIAHRDISADRTARYTVKARSCEVSIDYDWGEPALHRR